MVLIPRDMPTALYNWVPIGDDTPIPDIKTALGGIKDDNDTRHVDLEIICVDTLPGGDF